MRIFALSCALALVSTSLRAPEEGAPDLAEEAEIAPEEESETESSEPRGSEDEGSSPEGEATAEGEPETSEASDEPEEEAESSDAATPLDTDEDAPLDRDEDAPLDADADEPPDADEDAELAADLDTDEGVAGPSTDYDPLRDSPEALRARSWTGSGIAALTVGVALTAGSLAMALSDPCEPSAGNTCFTNARDRAAATMGIPGGVLVVAGAAMLGVGLSKRKKLRASVAWSPGGGALVLRGSF